ncbi:aminopeptidase [Alkalicoccobacillus murimartini]|uniref:Aminopeptidase n=1 Tax=Alkalicoccobacillus murimartini TaxID=171685 RepID=A0ABT9YHT3_9BACI|nr:aminopeptidase [Alkalicoccobacillus murimartini]MDQ0207428.1 aminopeptidase [Alkalicoccobacillus murimartini]
MSYLEKLVIYTDLILKVGLNVQLGDRIQLKFNSEQLELARLIVRRAYQLGAAHIVLDLQDDEMLLAQYEHLHDPYLDTYPAILADHKLDLYKEGYMQLSLLSPNPGLFDKLDTERVGKINKARSLAMQNVMRYGMENHSKWVIAAAASKAWAKIVFPQLPEAAAVEQLWEQVFMATRVLEENPVEAWRKHDQLLKKYQAYLNHKQYQKIHFMSEGTDLLVGLVDGHSWNGGSEQTSAGDVFMSNMPVEEIWTMPDTNQVNGSVSMTKLLEVGGKRVNNLKLEFEGGEVTKVISDQKEVVNQLLNTDAGARYLGEVALVSVDSPIEKTGIHFYNTLFDENAASHLALGQAYADNLIGSNEMSREEREQHGMNHSSIHVDFMIGSEDMSVFGVTKEGQKEKIMEKGRWII